MLCRLYKVYFVWQTLANYFKVLLAKESQNTKYNRLLFIFWVLGCIPLVEIFRNDMIAKIVESKYLDIDSIEDFLDTNLKALATAGDVALWKAPSFISFKDIEYESVRQNYHQLFNRTKPMFFDDPNWLNMFNNPKQMIELFRTTAILEDEFAIKFFAKVLGEIIPIHLSRESYFPQFVTPICYNQNFTYITEIVKLYVHTFVKHKLQQSIICGNSVDCNMLFTFYFCRSRELFEKGFTNKWNNLKHDYYGTFGKRIFKLLAGDDVLDRMHAELDEKSEAQTMTNLFEYILRLYLVLLIANCSVFVLELANYFIFKRIISRLQASVFLLFPSTAPTEINDRMSPIRSLHSFATHPHSSISF